MSRGLREETFCRREGMRTNESVERATSSRKLWDRGIWNWFDQILNRTQTKAKAAENFEGRSSESNLIKFLMEHPPYLVCNDGIFQAMIHFSSLTTRMFFTWCWNIWKMWNTNKQHGLEILTHFCHFWKARCRLFQVILTTLQDLVLVPLKGHFSCALLEQ